MSVDCLFTSVMATIRICRVLAVGGDTTSRVASSWKTASHRYRAQKGEEKARIFKLLLQGEGKEASERVIAWNKNYPKSVHFRMHEVSPSALVDYLAKLAESYGKEKAGESSRAKKLAAQRRKELFERMKAVNQELKVYQQGIAGGR